MVWSRVGIIGYGAVTHEIIKGLDARGALGSLVAVLETPSRSDGARTDANNRFAIVESLDALLGHAPTLIVEAAGQGAVGEYGSRIVSSGCDFMISSVGALANEHLALQILISSRRPDQIWIAAGAVAGVDGILGALTAGLEMVTYASLKPPEAWQGTPAEAILDETARARRTVFFEGSAREAALNYPQNANVAATIALAGTGLDHTRVVLASDPCLEGPLGIIDAHGAFGTFHFEILGLASPKNPKSSLITGHSLAAAIHRGMCFSVDASLTRSRPR